MKKIVLWVSCLLGCVLILAVVPLQSEAQLYENVIRLHILANSDSAEDQNLKYQVRDRILRDYGSKLAALENIEKAKAEVETLLPEIQKTAEDEVRLQGKDASVSVSFDMEYYPHRDYENMSFPAGKYLSLRIFLGEGEGANWWCVLFPPLCVSTAYGEHIVEDDSIPVGLTPEQYRLITQSENKQYILKFKVLELLEILFCG